MRHSALLGIIGAVAFAAAMALIAASVAMEPPALSAPAAGGADVVRRFYAAANDAIATGDPAALHDVVAPHFVEHDPLPGVPSGREGLADYLAALHATAPGTRLVVEEVAASNDLAVAQVTAHGGQGATPLDGAIAAQPGPWGPVDVFRVSGGKIVERWSHTAELGLVRPLAEVALDFPTPAPRVLTPRRVTIAAGARWVGQAAGPRVLVLEDGTLRVETAAAPLGQDASASAAEATGAAQEATVATFTVPELPG